MYETAPQSAYKIMFVVESFSTGVFSIIRDIAVNLDPDLFSIHIVHSLRCDSPKNYQEVLHYQHISLKYVPMDSFHNYLKAISSIKKEIASYRPDVIHLHSSKAGFIGRIASRKLHFFNVFYSPHGFSFVRSDVGPLRRTLFLYLEKLICEYAGGTIIAVSNSEIQEAKRITHNAVVINNFIEVPVEKNFIESSNPIIVTSGRISPQKNPALFNHIAKKIPNASFIWVGDGPLRDVLTSKNITITGYLTRNEVITYLVQSWVYLQTSKWEGMPVSVLEAMSIGKPVVASDIMGNNDLIEQGINGYLCNLENVNDFVHQILELIENKDQRITIGNEAKAYVVRHHNIKHAVSQYTDLYITSTISSVSGST